MSRIMYALLSLALSVGLCGPFVIAVDGEPHVVEVAPFTAIGATPTQEIVTPHPTLQPCTIWPDVPNYINLRTLPSTMYGEIVGQMPESAVVPEAYYENDLTWYQFDNTWVAAVSSLHVEGDCTNLPFVDPF